jgi:ATP-binding cassette, subfamily B, multidrug efflux pump
MNALRRISSFVAPYRVQAITSLTILFCMVGADLLIPRLTQRIIDQGITAGNLRVVVTTSLIMLGASVVSAGLALANNYISVRVAMSVGADLRSAIMRKVQTFSFENLDTLQTGKLIVHATSDVNMVQMIVMMSLRILSRAPIWVIGATILLVMTSHRLALMMAGFVPIIAVMIWVFSRKAQPLFRSVQERLDRLNTVLQENLAGVRVVKAFVRTRHEEERFDGANEALMNRTIEVSVLLATFLPAFFLVLNLAVVGAVWIGGWTTIQGEMTVGEVVAAINYLSFALFPILLLGGMLGPLSAAEASAMRILEILDDPSQVRPPDRPVTLGRPRGRIVFEKVAFSYNGNGAEPVLSDVSFTAEPGETVAILGATGSGKSTLIHLIPRFYDVTAGKVSFDGTDLRHLDLPWLRSTVGLVLQESVLFGGTVRDNICFGRMAATDAEVKAAARAAQAEAFIDALPHGYATVIGQRGVTLSGGQRQRIAIARALLVKPKVLILDDATSALDIETEIRLQDALERLISRSQDTTTRFVVAQRISTVLLADKILLLDQGRIKAMGTHRELLDRDVTYQDIYRSQLGEPPGKSGGQHG